MFVISLKEQGIYYHHSLTDNPDPGAFKNHTHEAAELYLFLRGNAVFHVEGTAYPLSPGDVVIMRPAESHYVDLRDTAPYERIAVNFPLKLFNELDLERRLIQPFISWKSGTRNLYRAEQFRENLKEQFFDKLEEEGGDFYFMSSLLSVLSELTLLYERESGKKPAEETREQAVIRYINHHLSEPLTLDLLSEKFFMSPSTLERKFKKATGTTVAKYVGIKRLVRAHFLLENGARPTEVFREVGFSDYSAFFRAYREKYGSSPKTAT